MREGAAIDHPNFSKFGVGEEVVVEMFGDRYLARVIKYLDDYPLFMLAERPNGDVVELGPTDIVRGTDVLWNKPWGVAASLIVGVLRLL